MTKRNDNCTVYCVLVLILISILIVILISILISMSILILIMMLILAVIMIPTDLKLVGCKQRLPVRPYEAEAARTAR